MQRLTQKVGDHYSYGAACAMCQREDNTCDGCPIRTLITRLGELEDKEFNGRENAYLDKLHAILERAEKNGYGSKNAIKLMGYLHGYVKNVCDYTKEEAKEFALFEMESTLQIYEEERKGE